MGERPPAGWYHDASGRERWFDGETWSDIYRSAPEVPAPRAPAPTESVQAEAGSGQAAIATGPDARGASPEPTPARSQSTVAPTAAPTDGTSVTPPRTHRFRRVPVLEGWLVGLLLLALILWLLALIFDAEAIRLVNAVLDRPRRDWEAELIASDNRQAVLGLVLLITSALIAIFFLVWLHRMSRNARALGADSMRHSPTGAVGWWFVPVAAWFMPFLVMRELWLASARPHDWAAAKPSTPATLGWFWAAWVGSGVAGIVALRVVPLAPTFEVWQVGMGFRIATDLLSLVAASLALAIVWRLSAIQTAEARALGVAVDDASADGDQR